MSGATARRTADRRALGEDCKRLRAMNRPEAPKAFSPDRVACRIAELAAPLGVSVKTIKRKVADATLRLTQALGVCRARVQRRVA